MLLLHRSSPWHYLLNQRRGTCVIVRVGLHCTDSACSYMYIQYVLLNDLRHGRLLQRWLESQQLWKCGAQDNSTHSLIFPKKTSTQHLCSISQTTISKICNEWENIRPLTRDSHLKWEEFTHAQLLECSVFVCSSRPIKTAYYYYCTMKIIYHENKLNILVMATKISIQQTVDSPQHPWNEHFWYLIW